ncbi:hypothetical protein, partial [Morganella sp. BCCO 40_0007]|uniref:hypothetical protein n=1 Tax=Morganella sp. BCCO 40_0007 TaxID=3068325 RepID=UPI002943D590
MTKPANKSSNIHVLSKKNANKHFFEINTCVISASVYNAPSLTRSNTLRSAPAAEKSEKVEKQRLTRRGWKRNIRSLATTQKTGNGSECCNCSLTIYQ